MKEKLSKDGKYALVGSILALILGAIYTIYPEETKTFLHDVCLLCQRQLLLIKTNYQWFVALAGVLITSILVFRWRRAHFLKATWINELNKLYPSKAKIHKVLYKEPLLQYNGRYKLTTAQSAIAEKIFANYKPNDPHAILDENVNWKGNELIFPYKTLMYHEVVVLRMAHFEDSEYTELTKNHNFDVNEFIDEKGESIIYHTADDGVYINIRALPDAQRDTMEDIIYQQIRNRQGKPKVLSANAVIVCPETQQIFIHHRSMKSATDPGLFHTIGGAYAPPELNGSIKDASFFGTACREVQEETLLPMSWDTKCPIIYSEELSTGFIQIVYLGGTFPEALVNVQVHVKDWVDTPQELEGRPKHVDFKDLGKILFANDRWVPSGSLHILSWLALGAQGCQKNPSFNGLSATQLFNSYIRFINKSRL